LLRSGLPYMSAFSLVCALALPAQAQQAASMGAVIPSFALAGPAIEAGKTRWDGQYFKVSSGFAVTSFRHGPTVGGPTAGLSVGKMWQQGALVWGVEGGIDYQPVTYRSNRGSLPLLATYDRDLVAGARFKAGILAQDNLLFYTSVGAQVARETWRYSPALVATGITGLRDEKVQLRPDVRAGVEWAVTDKLRLNLEVSAQPGWR
jgi:outer membrane immunogenic protein